ncbi:uncharacterized protein [Cherax quadricarinatus]
MSIVMMRSVRGWGVGVWAAQHKHTLAPEQSQQGQQQPQQQKQKMHQAVSGMTIARPSCIPMPPNVEEIQASEKARFSRRRTRDISSKLNQMGSLFGSGFMGDQGSRGAFNTGTLPVDSHVDVYDSRITVSLSSVMQTNVPKPFEISGKAPVHLNMPGGQWAQDDKYVSGDLQDCHHSIIVSKKNSGTTLLTLGSLVLGSPMKCVNLSRQNGLCPRGLMTACGSNRIDSLNFPWISSHVNSVCLISNNSSACHRIVCGRGSQRCSRYFNTCAVCNNQDSQSVETKSSGNPKGQLTSKQKLQRAVKEYGATVIVFHVTISLASLGICYLLVSSGVDMTGVIESLGINIGKLTEVAVTGVTETSTTVASVPEAVTLESLQKDSVAEVVAEDVASGIDVDTNPVSVNDRVAGAATFVVAYAVHKVFAPARIAITLTATPFIVRHLRKIGFLKPPKPKLS